MTKHNLKEHRLEKVNGIIILQSKHVGEVVEVYIDKEKRRFYGKRIDGTFVYHDGDCGNDFAQPVMLYKVYYCFENDSWGVGYRIKDTKEKKWKDGFATAREAWLYREALIYGDIAKR